MHPALRYAISALLGALAALGYAPIGWFPLPILTLAGLFWLAREAAPGRAFLLGWAYGLGLFLAGVSWIFVSISTYGGMPFPIAALATLLFCAFMALWPAAALSLGARLAASGWTRSALALPVAWALLEWTRGWLLTGFPWLALGYSQVPASPLAGYAPVLGVYGVTLLAALSAGALTLMARFGRSAILCRHASDAECRQGIADQRSRWAFAFLAVLWLGGWGLQQIDWTQPAGAPVSVALLQGNIAQDMKFRPEKLDETLRHYARAVLASQAKLIILPETALPLFRSDIPRDYLGMLADHAKKRGGDVLAGVPEDDGRDTNGNARYYNSVISLGGSPEGRYAKAHLVPFGEFVPFGFRWAVDMMSIPLGDFARGAADQPALAAAGEKLAVNVCYEDVFGEERIHAARDATLLVNVSNDAWFGDSWAPWQHMQIGAMRSLEAGRWQLRANNTGITAILDDKGRVRAQLAPFTTGTLTGDAQGRIGDTPYLIWGNWAFLALVATLLAMHAIFNSPLRRKSTP
ncbi:MAG: apolipoprotein N-acyltransferase [Hydrogenophilales bacterium 28-61-23]|nr:MAG: apolipoprotein N-acyltransferase [Hydrogenophilales bacterium 28-61-23]